MPGPPMNLLRWILILGAAPLLAQSPEYFADEAPPWWQPKWELKLQGDRITTPLAYDGYSELNRGDGQLCLRWEGGNDSIGYQVGLRAATGTDGNRANIPRWDQQPSNGTQLDVAHVDIKGASEHGFAELRLGFQDNPLLSPEGLWDRDLRFLGGGLRLGLRDPGGLVQEAGVRIAAGRVRLVQMGDVDLAAAQAVVKLETGPLSWTTHVGRWDLRWDRGFARRRPVPGHELVARQKLTMDAGGLGVRWNLTVPIEVQAFVQRNVDTREDGAEYQFSLGGLERPFWPRFSYIWQRFDRTGTLYPVNTDQWWFYQNARGPRYEASLPLPARWLLSAVYLRHQTYGAEYPAERRIITLTKRF